MLSLNTEARRFGECFPHPPTPRLRWTGKGAEEREKTCCLNPADWRPQGPSVPADFGKPCGFPLRRSVRPDAACCSRRCGFRAPLCLFREKHFQVATPVLLVLLCPNRPTKPFSSPRGRSRALPRFPQGHRAMAIALCSCVLVANANFLPCTVEHINGDVSFVGHVRNVRAFHMAIDEEAVDSAAVADGIRMFIAADIASVKQIVDSCPAAF